MTISIALSQSQWGFSVSRTPSWIWHPQLASSPLKTGSRQQPFSPPPPLLAWTAPETSRRRRPATVRLTRRRAQSRTTGSGRRPEECWRSWSRGAVSRRSGLRSQRMSSGLWGRTSPRTMSSVSGPSRRVSWVQFHRIKSRESGWLLSGANCS